MMKEQATLTYINEIAGNDVAYQQKLLDIIKSEFPEEKAQYIHFYNTNNFIQSAEMVHKLKHKINIFGLEQSYTIAKDFENQLRDNNNQLHSKFLTILEHIETYLNNL